MRAADAGAEPHRATLLGAALAVVGLELATVPARGGDAGPVHLRTSRLDVEADEGLARLEQLPEPRLPSRPSAAVPSTTPRIASFTSVQVNVTPNGLDILGDAANEPSLAVDPRNPNHMVIGWRQFDTVASIFQQAGCAFSQDGGRTWRSHGVLDPGVARSDPVLGADAEGRFYYDCLRWDGATLHSDFFVSQSGGQTWTGPFDAWGGDKPWIAIDRTESASHGNIYETWSTAASCCGVNTFTRSTTAGVSFETPVGVPSNPQWGSMDIAPDGTVYLAGVDSNEWWRILVAKSTSARDRTQIPVFESTTEVDLGGEFWPFPGPGGPNPRGLLGQVWIAVDPSSGPHAGWIYLVCSLDPPGTADPLDVFFSRSTDRGATWSAPRRLNGDAPGAWQWFATMGVAPDGRIDVVWNDTRDTGAPNLSALYYTSSRDGGTTWMPNTKLSPVWDSWIGWPSQNKIGDYSQLVSDDVGANLAWAATFNGGQDVWFLRIGDRDCNGNGIGDASDIASGMSRDANHDGIPDECQPVELAAEAPRVTGFRLLQNVPNPFNPSTEIPFEAAGGRAVRIEILDVGGRVVRSLSPESGRGGVHWDGRDSRGEPVAAGVYVYRMMAPGFVASNRMVRVR